MTTPMSSVRRGQCPVCQLRDLPLDASGAVAPHTQYRFGRCSGTGQPPTTTRPEGER